MSYIFGNYGKLIVYEETDNEDQSVNGVANLIYLSAADDGNADGRMDISTFGGIITSFETTDIVNHRFQHTLGGRIFLYVFGDEITRLNVSGICAGNVCDPDHKTMQDFITWYNEHKLTKRETEPVTAVIADIVYKGYILGLTTKLLSTETELMSFNLSMGIYREPER